MRLLAIITWLLITVAAVGCSRGDSSPSPGASPAASTTAPALAAGLTRVTDPSQVCMVNDTFMGKPQIPVEAEGRTYYGCCPACKDRLMNDPTIRVATDPVSGQQVDKAAAIIAYDGAGKVLYFASEDALRSYRGPK